MLFYFQEHFNLLLDSCISVCDHCAISHKSAKQYYDQLNFVEILKPYIEHGNDEIKTECLFCLSYIVDEENNDIFSSNSSHITFLIDTFKKTIASGNVVSETGWTPAMLSKGIKSICKRNMLC